MNSLEANPEVNDLNELHIVDDDFAEDQTGKNGTKTGLTQSRNEERQMSMVESAAHKFLRGFWATRQIENVKNRRVFIKTTLRELIIYLTFLLLLLLITLLMVNSMTYFYFDSVYDLFVGDYTDPNDGSTMKFNSISDLETVWKYLKGQLIQGLYWDTWYNQLNASFSETQFIGFDNKLLGVPRLRQLRANMADCKVPKKMMQLTSVCYPDYSYGTPSQEPIIPKQNLTPVYTKNAWRFQTASETGATSYSAPINTYDGSGFIQDLSRDPVTSIAILDELFRGLWIDQGTRVLFVDFTIYNANINMFVIVKLIFEMSYTGGVFVGNEFQAAKLIRYVTSVDYFVMVCEVLFILFVLYYIVEECLEIKKNKWRYFLGAWNVLDIVVIACCLFCIVLAAYCTATANSVISNLVNQLDSHPHFDVLSYWYGHFVRATAMCVFLAVLKVFKYVDFDRSLGQLTRTLSIACYDLIGFLVMFCIVYFAFAQLSYLAFGAATDGFQSFTQACYSLFRMMVGDINFPALRKANFFLGPVFFLLYIFFAVFVLLNMFLAIINDAYAVVKDDLAKQRTQLKLGSMVKKRAKEALAKMRKKSRKSLIQILQQCHMLDREILPFDEYRRVLKKFGYGDAEITSTFVKYDRDGDNCLNVKEQRCMEDELEIGIRKSAKNLDEDEGHGTDEEAEHEEIEVS
ncbi:Polycystic kidney disease 2 1 (Predicted) [Fasciolopsis buskii]|uniref:Polycystic kidney disease 2 1 (Predicted) n=1 Tax=Fasciolopsis buskii TaxID=27845 RepID=A0A8E0RQZ7_9TREM|nr:Polycystic kidney disease 2 1 (Predicted) [Fasciolopsis buski]